VKHVRTCHHWTLASLEAVLRGLPLATLDAVLARIGRVPSSLDDETKRTLAFILDRVAARIEALEPNEPTRVTALASLDARRNALLADLEGR
jgi:hypothetical protein